MNKSMANFETFMTMVFTAGFVDDSFLFSIDGQRKIFTDTCRRFFNPLFLFLPLPSLS